MPAKQMKVRSHPLYTRLDGIGQPLFEQSGIADAIVAHAIGIAPTGRVRDDNGTGWLAITQSPLQLNAFRFCSHGGWHADALRDTPKSSIYYWRRTSTMKLNYVIKFVSDMTRAVSFYRDLLGLPLKFESPGWTEFTTGETTLALHPASDKNPAGSLQLGFGVADIQTFYDKMVGSGVEFTMRPKTEFGALLARFLDSEGAECTVAEH